MIGATALCWVFRPLRDSLRPGVNLNDTSIAMLAAVALFVIPVEFRKGVFAIDGEWAAKLPWGVVVLFAAGIKVVFLRQVRDGKDGHGSYRGKPVAEIRAIRGPEMIEARSTTSNGREYWFVRVSPGGMKSGEAPGCFGPVSRRARMSDPGSTIQRQGWGLVPIACRTRLLR